MAEERKYKAEELREDLNAVFLIYKQYDVASGMFVLSKDAIIDGLNEDTYLDNISELQDKIKEDIGIEKDEDYDAAVFNWVVKNVPAVEFDEYGEVVNKFRIDEILKDKEKSVRLFLDKNYKKREEIFGSKVILYNELIQEILEDNLEFVTDIDEYLDFEYIFEKPNLGNLYGKLCIRKLEDMLKDIKSDVEYDSNKDYIYVCNFIENYLKNNKQKIIDSKMKLKDVLFDLIELEDKISDVDKDFYLKSEENFVKFCFEHNIYADEYGNYICNLILSDFDISDDFDFTEEDYLEALANLDKAINEIF